VEDAHRRGGGGPTSRAPSCRGRPHATPPRATVPPQSASTRCATPSCRSVARRPPSLRAPPSAPCVPPPPRMGEYTLQKIQRKNVVPCMGELEPRDDIRLSAAVPIKGPVKDIAHDFTIFFCCSGGRYPARHRSGPAHARQIKRDRGRPLRGVGPACGRSSPPPPVPGRRPAVLIRAREAHRRPETEEEGGRAAVVDLRPWMLCLRPLLRRRSAPRPPEPRRVAPLLPPRRGRSAARPPPRCLGVE
jgi:hypothetical protein